MSPSLDNPGKYHEEAALVRCATGATGVLLIVAGGRLGAGFEVQGQPHFIARLPDMLEQVAAEIRLDPGYQMIHDGGGRAPG